MNKDIKQLAEEMLDSISKVNGFSDFDGVVLDYDLHYTTITTLKDVITAAMVEMYTAGAREATTPEERSKQLKADLYLFRDMYCQNIDLSTIDEYVDGLATTTPLSSSSGEAPLNNNNSIEQEGGYYYDLFKFFSDNHNLILVDSEIQDIIHAVEKFNNHPVRRIINDTWDGRCRCGHLQTLNDKKNNL